jgi:hypothetical protein
MKICLKFVFNKKQKQHQKKKNNKKNKKKTKKKTNIRLYVYIFFEDILIYRCIVIQIV